jgi:ribosome biogenesis GTPase / thiamine phosphate phosphatase
VPLPDESTDALVSYGWSDRVLALFSAVAEPPDEPGRVIRVERAQSVVVRRDGSEGLVTAAETPAVGDWVVLHGNVIRQVLPRWSALTRQAPAGDGIQILAANVDVVLITAPADRLSPARVERELAVAWESGAQPLVLLTKIDLADGNAEADLRSRLVGVDVVATSTVTGEGLDRIAAALHPHKSAALLGPSGAGKSTLTNWLLGSDQQATADVRDGDHRGRHTTTSRQLSVLPQGGVLIDSPGLRSLGLTGDTPIDQVFPEIDALAAECRFADCSHDQEPDCAVLAALADGTLDADRVASFRKLQKEAALVIRNEDPLVRKAELTVWKARIKEARLKSKRKQG